ncbi:MAG: hypothetical protein GY842_05865 [bacterium]|nr:hypothetical protein [bacterium]
MIELDPSLLAPDVAVLLQLRGAALPPLAWHLRPNNPAKRMLDERSQDTALLSIPKVIDEGMAGVVRAALYLWNGWADECRQYAESGPQSERQYLLGVCARQANQLDEAKSFFQQVPEHPIYTPMAERAPKIIGSGGGAMLQRYRAILEQDVRWETCAFVDLWGQAAAGKLGSAGEQTVQELQCLEFELLFKHCYEQATGQKLRARVKETIDREAVVRMRKNRESRAREARGRRPEAQRPEQKTGPEPAKQPVAERPKTDIVLACPKCKTKASIPISSRGSQHRCTKCGASFLVPRDQAAGFAQAPQTSASVFGLRCPRCTFVMRVSESARGKQEKCGKCGAAVMVPPRKATPAAAAPGRGKK